MKRLFYCLLLIGLGSFWVQLSSQSLQLEDKVLNALSTLDQTQVPSGLLYERVPSYYLMEYFRGNYLSDTTSVLINRISVFYGMIIQNLLFLSFLDKKFYIFDKKKCVILHNG